MNVQSKSNTDNNVNCNNSSGYNNHEYLSPTSEILLPRNLLDSPVINDELYIKSTSSSKPQMNKQKYSYLPIPIMHLKTDNNCMVDSSTTISTETTTNIGKSIDKCFKGFFLKTTNSNVNFIINDPYIIENLILLPMTKSFLYLVKKWEHEIDNPASNCNSHQNVTVCTVNTTNTTNEINDHSFTIPSYPCYLIHLKGILIELYKNYIEIYGNFEHVKHFVNYALKDFPECNEKFNLLKMFSTNKILSMNVLNNLDEVSSQTNNNNNHRYEYNLIIDRTPTEYQCSLSSTYSISPPTTTLCSWHSSSIPIISYDWYNNYSMNMINISSLKSIDNLSEVNKLKSDYIIQTKPTSSNRLIANKLNEISLNGSKSNINALSNIRYKTEVCKYFKENSGYCPAGEKCHYAHGKVELRDPKSHPKFRSQLCRHYLSTGNCLFGDKCYFKHSLHNLPSTSSETSPKMKEINNEQNSSPDSTSQSNQSFLNSRKVKSKRRQDEL
ncbi:hypothetical protein MN116_004128 [Schistosoma mekongi]|uniref:C3H1-type domain-containing protein n=1 Tax=Schistosoma mekongi TaxID=38744 RepID=A0AAE1ZFE8_SCHME|nr:hypothetical protein MN116_004128 [Schistosoma mekongi]